MSHQCPCDNCPRSNANNTRVAEDLVANLSNGNVPKQGFVTYLNGQIVDMRPHIACTITHVPISDECKDDRRDNHDITVGIIVDNRNNEVKTVETPVVETPVVETPVVETPITVAQRVEELKAQRALIPVDPTAVKLSWQQAVFDKLRNNKETTINWLVADSVGKTNFSKYHCGDAIVLRAPDHIWGYIKGASDPVLNQRSYKEDHLDGKAFVFDIDYPSFNFDYELLSHIKDGSISSALAGPRQWTSPNVWVLARSGPTRNVDKIVQWRVVNNELVPFHATSLTC